MRLTKEEEETIHDWWKSDFDIEVERTRYTAILESNVQYIHYPDGSYDRKHGNKRHLHVYTERGDSVEYNIETFNSPEKAIEFLSEKGALRKLQPVLEENNGRYRVSFMWIHS